MAACVIALVLVAMQLGAGAGAADRAGRERERVSVLDVVGSPDAGFVVLLRTEREPYRYLPIIIGRNEALALSLRLGHLTPDRPLTIHLLDSVLKATRVSVIEVSINDQQEGAFLGRVRLRERNGRLFDVDARPSDLLGLAAGTAVPIFVSRRVLEAAGFDAHDLARKSTPAGASTSYDESL